MKIVCVTIPKKFCNMMVGKAQRNVSTCVSILQCVAITWFNSRKCYTHKACTSVIVAAGAFVYKKVGEQLTQSLS